MLLLILLHYLVTVENTENRKYILTQIQLLMLTTKVPLNASDCIDSLIKCSDESYK